MAEKNTASDSEYEGQSTPESKKVDVDALLNDINVSNLIHDELEGVLKEERKKKVEEKPKPPHLTYGIPDSVLQKPVSEGKIIPKGMEAYAGNEDGVIEGEIAGSPFVAITNHAVKYKINDDGIFVDPESGTLMVTDGMGGHPGGWIASAVTTHTLAQKLLENKRKKMPPLPLRETPTVLHRSLLEYQEHNKKYEACGTTMSAIRVHEDGRIEGVNVGDSKILHIRNGEIKYETRDDNYLNYRIHQLEKANKKNKYKLSKEEIRKEALEECGNYRDSLISCIGSSSPVINFDTGETGEESKTVNPNYFEIKDARPGDIILSCSDGISDTYPPYKIAKFLKEQLNKGDSLKQALQKLIDVVKYLFKSGKGKRDNISISAILIQ